MTSTSTPPTTPSPCPTCGAPANGRFCASCGAPLETTACTACRTPLSKGARFCHRCGTAVGAALPAGTVPAGGDAIGAPGRSGGFQGALPWAVAGIALLAFVAYVAGQRFNARATSTADAAVAPQGAQEEAAQQNAISGIAGAAARAPDISSMSPRERADRLYDRIMRLDSEGKKDSVAFFSQMGVAAYQMLPQQDLDTRYDMGRIAEVAGAVPLARAQADSILAADPNHLLGLSLAISLARDAGNEDSVRALQKHLLTAQASELAKNLPEYQRHQGEIAAAIDAAKTH